MIRFPVDCPEDCPFHETFDLSVDDWTHICTRSGKQIDEYDCGFPELLPICPIEKGEKMSKGYEYVRDPKKRAIIEKCPHYYFGECSLEFHHRKICPSEKCFCADKFGYKARRENGLRSNQQTGGN